MMQMMLRQWAFIFDINWVKLILYSLLSFFLINVNLYLIGRSKS